MNIRMLTGIMLLLFNVACTDHLYQRSIPPNDRRTVVQGDTLHSFTVATEKTKVSTQLDKFYAWYLRSNLGHTQGGYEGDLLDGPYTKMLRDNTLLEKGQFQEGLKDGEWISWHPNGAVATTKQWNQGKPQGNEQTYRTDGALRQSQRFRKGELHGEETVYLPFQESPIKTKHIRTWKKGKLTGPYTIYDSLDQVHEQGSYLNGERDGRVMTYQRFTDKNQNTTVVKQIHTYRAGQLHGAFAERYPDGHLQQKGQYRNGILHGKVTTYEPAVTATPSKKNNYTKQVYSWKDEQYDGPFTEYDATGKPLRKGTYRNGQLHGKLTTWNEEGEETIQYYQEGAPVEKQKLTERLKSLKSKRKRSKKDKEEVTENLPE